MADQINTEEERLERLRKDLQVRADECEGVLIHIHRDELRALLSASQPVAGQAEAPTATASDDIPLAQWTDRDGVLHTMTCTAALDTLRDLFERWPGGLDEIEASVDGWRRRAQEAALSQPSAGTAGGADVHSGYTQEPSDD